MASRTAPITVFLAEDSPEICQRVDALLAREGMSIAGAAATPQACIEGILAAHPAAVVLDVQLEGGTGLEVLKAVRAVEPRIAFVVFSNTSAPAYRRRYLAEGASCFLDKSTEFDQLAQAVESACDAIVH